MSQTPFSLTRDINGYVGYGLKFINDETYGTYGVLAANTVAEVIAPSGPASVFEAIFSYTPGASVWVQLGNSPTLALPSGTFADTTAELNPSVRDVPAGSTIQLLSGTANVAVNIIFRALSGQVQ